MLAKDRQPATPYAAVMPKKARLCRNARRNVFLLACRPWNCTVDLPCLPDRLRFRSSNGAFHYRTSASSNYIETASSVLDSYQDNTRMMATSRRLHCAGRDPGPCLGACISPQGRSLMPSFGRIAAYDDGAIWERRLILAIGVEP